VCVFWSTTAGATETLRKAPMVKMVDGPVALVFGHVVAGRAHGLGERVVHPEERRLRLVVASPQEVAHVSLGVLVQLHNGFHILQRENVLGEKR